MTVKVWAPPEFLQEAKASAAREFAGAGVDQGADDWLGAIVKLLHKAHDRGDGLAVYVNHDLGHRDIGQWQIVSYGSIDSQLETREKKHFLGDLRTSSAYQFFQHDADTLPNTLPDIGGNINWRYQLEAIVPATKPCSVVEGCVYREGHDVEVFPHRVDYDSSARSDAVTEEERRERRAQRDINWALIAGAGVQPPEQGCSCTKDPDTGALYDADGFPCAHGSGDEDDDDDGTYRVVRFFQDERPKEVIETGLSLDDAQAHCKDDSTHGEGWFDGYEEE